MNGFEALLSDIENRIACQQGNEGEPAGSPTPVFRVEMPDGHGPFNDPALGYSNYERLADFGCCDLAGPEHNHEQCGITELAFRDAHGAAYYGCDSLSAVAKWFPPPSRDYLARLGAHIVQYEVPADQYIYRVGEGEVIFNRDTAKRVRSLPINGDYHA